METKSIPRLKGQVLTKKLNVALESDLDVELRRLKSDYKVDVPEWIRGLIKENLPKLKSKLAT